ncbi:MAG: 2TM domain-containing protein [Nocardioides sp.]
MTESVTTSEYNRARARLLKKRKFRSDLATYVAVNAFFVGIWAVSGFGYFWAGWILAAWGLGLVLTAWDLFYRHDVTEEDIQREMRKAS